MFRLRQGGTGPLPHPTTHEHILIKWSGGQAGRYRCSKGAG